MSQVSDRVAPALSVVADAAVAGQVEGSAAGYVSVLFDEAGEESVAVSAGEPDYFADLNLD